MATREYFYDMKEIGEIGELLYTKLLEESGNEIIFVAPKDYSFPYYDIAYKNELGYEVSAEVKTETTNSPNLAFQTRRNGKPSGVTSTKAQLYCIYNIHDKAFYIVESCQIRYAIYYKTELFLQTYNKRNSTENVEMFLLDKDDFLKLPTARIVKV